MKHKSNEPLRGEAPADPVSAELSRLAQVWLESDAPSRDELLTAFALAGERRDTGILYRIFSGRPFAVRFALVFGLLALLVGLAALMPGLRLSQQGLRSGYSEAWAQSSGQLLVLDLHQALGIAPDTLHVNRGGYDPGGEMPMLSEQVEKLRTAAAALNTRRQGNDLEVFEYRVQREEISSVNPQHQTKLVPHPEKPGVYISDPSVPRSRLQPGDPGVEEVLIQFNWIAGIAVPADASAADLLAGFVDAGINDLTIVDAVWFERRGLPNPQTGRLALELELPWTKHYFSFPSDATVEQIQQAVQAWLDGHSGGVRFDVVVELERSGAGQRLMLRLRQHGRPFFNHAPLRVDGKLVENRAAAAGHFLFRGVPIYAQFPAAASAEEITAWVKQDIASLDPAARVEVTVVFEETETPGRGAFKRPRITVTEAPGAVAEDGNSAG